MYPVVFQIGTFEVTSFGVMVAVGALVGLWLFNREIRRARLPDSAFDAAVAGIVGGMVGAKVIWTLEHAGSGPIAELLFSRGGLSWYGGLAGGVLAGLILITWRQLSTVAVLAAAAPALAIGHAIGRIGCFLVGDDYGWPTDLPWGVAFPRGLPPTDVPVHPTQLYEAFGLVPLAALLIHLRRSARPDAAVFGVYLLGAGALRFAIEFIRVHEPILGPLAIAHLASLAAIVDGAMLWFGTDREHVPQRRKS